MLNGLAGQKLAIIGATGFVGSHLTERLVCQGANVLAVARTTRRLVNLGSVQGRYSFAQCDILDRNALIDILKRFRPKKVFHLAARPDGAESFEHMAECIRVNTIGAIHVAEASAEAGTETLVYADSSKVYGNGPAPFRENNPPAPICSYAVAKAAAWQMFTLAAALNPMQIVSLRPSFIYGRRQNYNLISYVSDCIRRKRPIRLQGGNQTRDPLYIDDAVDAFALAALRPEAHGHAIPIGGGEEYAVEALCRHILATLRADGPIVENAEAPRITEIWRSMCDNSDAKRLLRWSPRIDLGEGLRRTLTAEAIYLAAQPGRVSVAEVQE